MDNNHRVDRRRTVQASPSPIEALKQLPALVLLERIPVPTLAVLQDGTIVFANTAFADILGRDAEEVVKLRFYDIFYGALETESVRSKRNRCSRSSTAWRTWSSSWRTRTARPCGR